MQAYEIYQEMSHDVYKLKNGGALTNISGSGGETWVLEKTYSSDKSMAKTDPNNKSGTENIQTGDGYAGAIYRNDKTGEVIVVNAGTQSRTDY